ncbi:MAG: protoporphyrinogen/coproporphyrinogen oxidase [bacterium]
MDVVIGGAGISGLTMGYFLDKKKRDYILLEKQSEPGGLCRSIHQQGFIFDYTGHLLHFRYPEIESFIKSLNLKLLSHKRRAYIFFNGKLISYPFQLNLHQLPPEIGYYCLYDFIQRRSCPNPQNSEEFFVSEFGKSIFQYFLEPYNQKLWTIKPKYIIPDWMGRFVPHVQLSEVLKPLFSGEEITDKGYNPFFYYPQNGISELPLSLVKKISQIKLNQEIIEVNWKEKKVITEQGTYPYGKLIWTLPLKSFLNLAQPAVPEVIKKSFNNLRSVKVLDLEMGFEGKSPEYHWVYLPEENILPYRVGCSSNFYQGKPGQFSIYAEIAFSRYKKIPPGDKKAVLEKVISSLKKYKLIDSQAKLQTYIARVIDPAYVIYDKNWKQSRKNIFVFFGKHSIVPVGRYAKWYYASMEDVIFNTLKIAEMM